MALLVKARLVCPRHCHTSGIPFSTVSGDRPWCQIAERGAQTCYVLHMPKCTSCDHTHMLSAAQAAHGDGMLEP